MNTPIEFEMGADAIIARIMADMEEVIGLIRRPTENKTVRCRGAVEGLGKVEQLRLSGRSAGDVPPESDDDAKAAA